MEYENDRNATDDSSNISNTYDDEEGSPISLELTNERLTKLFLTINIKRYFRMLNDQLLIWDIDTNIFKKVSGNYAIRDAQFNFLLKKLKNSLKSKYYINLTDKQLLSKIVNKIMCNPNLYSLDIRNELSGSTTCVPLISKQSIDDKFRKINENLKTMENIIFSPLKKKHNAIFYLDISKNTIQGSPYFEFLTHMNNAEPNIIYKTKKLIENISFNTSILTPACFFIEYRDPIILDLFLEPILYKIPSPFKAYYSLKDLKNESNILDLTGKTVNSIKFLKDIDQSNKSIFENFIFGKDFITCKGNNIKNTTTFIMCGSNEEFVKLCSLSDLFKNEAIHIKLPSEINKDLYEPDKIIEFCLDNNSFNEILYTQLKQEYHTGSYIVDEAYSFYIDSFQQFWNESIEITGSTRDPDSEIEVYYIQKNDLYSAYKNYCEKHALTNQIDRNIFGKRIANLCEFDKKMTLAQLKALPKTEKKFKDGKHSKLNKNCYFGIKFKTPNENS